jgi:hypothetical protein
MGGIHEMIHRANELDFTDDYRMLTEFPIATAIQHVVELSRAMVTTKYDKRIALFPALAIPVLNKSQFECPAAHVAALVDLLPHVDKLLVIGWRATETPFLTLLSKHLTSARCLVVAESYEAAKDTVHNMSKAGVSALYGGYGGGFSKFVIDREFRYFISLDTPYFEDRYSSRGLTRQ